MKLHLPAKLRAALLSCLTATATLIGSTIGTGTIAGGAFVATLTASATAQAAEVTGTGTADDPYVITSASGEVNLTTYTAQDYIKLNITGGYLPNADGTIAAHVIIDNFKLTDVNKDRTYTFTNTVSGSGEFSFSKASTNGGQAWDFQGDVSGFTGTVNISGNGGYLEELKFSGGGTVAATSINVADTLSIGNTTGRADENDQAYATTVTGTVTAGTLNVTGTTANSFSGSVTADTLNVNGTATNSFSGTVAAGSLDLAQNAQASFSGTSASLGTVTLADGSSLTGNAGTSATLTMLAENASANLKGSYGTQQLIVGAGNTLSIAEGANVNVSQISSLMGNIDLDGTLNLDGALVLNKLLVEGSGTLDLSGILLISTDANKADEITEIKGSDNQVTGWELSFNDLLTVGDGVTLADGSAEVLTRWGLSQSGNSWSSTVTVNVNGWDADWGPTTLAGAPVAANLPNNSSLSSYTEDIGNGNDAKLNCVFIGNKADYNSGGTAAVKITTGTAEADTYIIGGTPSTTSQLNTWIYIDTEADDNPDDAATLVNTVGTIVGGNLCNDWNAGSVAGSFTGESHILLKSGTANNIIGGNLRDGNGNNAGFVGSSYITVDGGNVKGFILGAGTSGHNATSAFVGNTNIWVNTLLTTDDASLRIDASTASNTTNLTAAYAAVAGGGATARNSTGNIGLAGNSSVIVDLSGYDLSDSKGSTFQKYIVGSSVISSTGGSGSQTGNSSVSVTSKDGLSFRDAIIGGHFNPTNGSSLSLTGNSSVSIDASQGGTFSADIVGGSYAMGSASVTHNNVTEADGSIAEETMAQVKIGGSDTAVFSGRIIGGSYTNSTAAATHNGAINVALDGGTYNGLVVLGGYMNARSGSITNNGTSTLTVASGSFNKAVIGGIREAAGNSTIVSSGITLALNGGTYQQAIVGGHNITGTGSANLTRFATGDIKLTLGDGEKANGGATANGIIFGGSTIQRGTSQAAADKFETPPTWTQGAISIVINSDATVNGSIYAGGGAYDTENNAASAYNSDVKLRSESTTVSIATGASFGGSENAPVTISGGYLGLNYNPTADEETHTLAATGAGTVDLSGSNIVLRDFTVADVAAGTTLNLGSQLATAGISTKIGDGTLAIAGDMSFAADLTLRVENGTLHVGNATKLSGLSLAADTTLELTAAGSSALSLDSLAIDAGAIVDLDLTGLAFDATQTEYVLAAFSAEQVLDLSQFRLSLGEGWTGELSYNSNNQLVLNANQILYWNGTGAWTAQDNDSFRAQGATVPTPWESGSQATLVFGADGAVRDVAIEGGLEVADMIVQAGVGNTYGFTASGGAITSLGSLSVESGSASFGAGALAVTSETGVTVSNGATLSLADKGTSTDGKLNIAMEGGSTLVWAGSSDVLEGNSLALSEGTVTLNIGSNDTSLAGLTNTAGSALTEATTIAVAGSGSVTLADDSIGSAGLDMGTGTTLAGAQHAANNAIAGAGSVGIDADTAWNGANKTYSGATNIADGVTVTAQGGISSGGTSVALGDGSRLVLTDGNQGFGGINTGANGTVEINTNGAFANAQNASGKGIYGSGTIDINLADENAALLVSDKSSGQETGLAAAINNSGDRFNGTYQVTQGVFDLNGSYGGKFSNGLTDPADLVVDAKGQVRFSLLPSGLGVFPWIFDITLAEASTRADGVGMLITSGGPLGSASVTGSLTMTNGTKLSVNGATEGTPIAVNLYSPLTLKDSVTDEANAGTSATLDIDTGDTLVAYGSLSTGEGTLRKTGAGTLKLAADSSANIALDAGTLDLGAASIGASVTAADGTAINASVDSTLASLTVSGGTTTLTGNATTLTGLSGSGTVDVQNDLTINGGDFAGTLEMNGDTGSLTLGAADAAANAVILLSNANATLNGADAANVYRIGSLNGTAGTVEAGNYQVSAGGEFSGTLANGVELEVTGGELKLGSNTAAEAEIRLTGASLGMASSVGEDEVVSIRNLTAEGSSTLNAGRYEISGANSAFAGKLAAGVQLTVTSGATLNLSGATLNLDGGTIQQGGPVNIIGEGGSTINELKLWSGITLHASNTGEDSQVLLSGVKFFGGSIQFDMTKVSDGEDGVPVYAPSTTAAYNGGGDLFIFGPNNLILNPGTGVSIQNGTYTLIENVGELEEKELGYLVLNYSSSKRLRHDLSLEQNGSQYDLVLTVSGEARSLTWQGDASGSGNWSYSDGYDPNQPWTYESASGTAVSDFSNGEAVTFGTLDGISGPAVVTVTTDVTAGSIVVKGDTSYTWTTENGSTVSTVAGGKLEVGSADSAFTGTLRLETETAIAGGVDINSGTVVAAHSWALKDSVVTVNRGATLKVDLTDASTKIYASSITMNDGSRLAATGNAGGTVNNVAIYGAVSLAGEGGAVLNAGLSSISSDSVLTTDGSVNLSDSPKDATFAALTVNSGTTRLGGGADLIVDKISGDGTLQVEGVLTSASSSIDIAHLAVNYGYMYSTAAEGTTVACLTTVSNNGTFFGTWTLENLADGADMNVGSLTSASNTASLTINQAKDATISVGYGSSLTVEGNATISSISNFYGGATVTLADDTTVGSLILESDSFAHYPANELNTATADGTITVTGSATIEKTTVNAAELVLMGNASLDLNTTVSTLTVSGQDSVTDEASGTVTPGTTVALGGTEIGHLLLESGTVATTSSTRVSLIEMSGGTLDFCGNNIGIAPPSTPDAPEPISMYGDIVMTGGSLAGAERYRGLIIINDAIGQTFEMGGLSDEATLMLQNAEGTQLTGLTGVTLGDGSLITISAGMTSEAEALLQFPEQGTAGVAENATVTVDINDVLGIVRGAENQSATFTLGNGYADLSDLNSAVTFDASLYLMNMQAEFTQDGKLTLTQLSPSDPDTVYIASEAQGDGNAAWAGNGDRLIYNSTEGYTVVVIDRDTTIDLNNGFGAHDPAEIPSNLSDVGLVLPNLIGTSGATLTIVGNNDGSGTQDLVTILPNVDASELPDNVNNSLSFDGTIVLQGTDLQLMAADAETGAANTDFVYRVGSLQADENSCVSVESGILQLEGLDGANELLGGAEVMNGVLSLNGNGNTLAGGVLVSENGQLQLHGNTTLSGDLIGSAYADPDAASADVELSSGKTLVLNGAALQDVSIEGGVGSKMQVAQDSSISLSCGVTGMLLTIDEGARLTIKSDLIMSRATVPAPGVLEYTGLTGKGALATETADTSATLTLNIAAGDAYTFEGSLADFSGTIALKGEGTQCFTQDAAATTFNVTGGHLVLADTVASVGSLQLGGTGHAYVNVATDGEANRTLAVTNGLDLAEGSTLHLNLNLTQEMLDGQAVITSDTASYTGGSVSVTLSGLSSGLDLTGGETVTATLASSGSVTDADVSLAQPEDKLLQKYFGDSAHLEVQGNNLVLTGTTVTADTATFHRSEALTKNGATGGAMLDQLYATLNPQQTDPNGTAAAVLDELEQLILAGDSAAADRQMAAVAGASATTMGMAFSGDIQRQLKAIRNRTTSMGVNDAYVNPDMPYFNAWVNAEGSYRRLEQDSTYSGYEFNSWGGTLGFDADITPQWTAGLAFTAMYGDLTAKSSEMAEGDLDTYYVTAFARYSPSALVHTFVASAGMADASLDRTVSYNGGSYRTTGDTDGLAFGLMYELGYTVPLDEEGVSALQPVFNITYTHSSIDGYTEKGGDLAVRFGEQKMDTLTLGLGLRAQTTIGENIYNRTSLLEGRVLAKCDVGDRSSTASAGFAALGRTAGEVESAEVGAFGVEVGAGLTVPVGQDGGSLFFDASLELRADYTNVNATVGYRINF